MLTPKLTRYLHQSIVTSFALNIKCSSTTTKKNKTKNRFFLWLGNGAIIRIYPLGLLNKCDSFENYSENEVFTCSSNPVWYSSTWMLRTFFAAYIYRRLFVNVWRKHTVHSFQSPNATPNACSHRFKRYW